MLFNSVHFFIFFPVVTAIYFVLPHRYRWIWLLAASCYFYMAFIPVYILILGITIVIDYLAGIWIEDSAGPKRRRRFLILSIWSTCLVLFVFKYYNFFAVNLDALAAFLGWNYSTSVLQLILPIGLSFHTFQSLSYVIEVYRGHQKAERHFGIYALYVMFYPQLVAGPIERPQNLLHQFYEHHRFVYDRVRSGLLLMLWGLFKKIVVADRLSIYVDAVYGNVAQHNGTTLALATVFFAFQIYCDFSGYSDIARGAAKVMGFNLMQNFDRPYFSKSIAEFWKRWHISLSTWFRDYVYLPLGGNRVARSRWYFNLLITFVISGLWHGANWTYIAWGALNGLYLVGSSVLAPLRHRLAEWTGLARLTGVHVLTKVLLTFLLACLGWVFFRAENLPDAVLILEKIAFARGAVFTGGAKDLIYGTMGIVLVLAFDYWTRGTPFEEKVVSKPVAIRWAVYLFLVMSILGMGFSMLLNSYTSSSRGIAKFALNAFIFLAVVFALDRAIGAAAEHFSFKTRDGDTGGQINGLLEKKADVLIFGSSRAESHYVPDVLSASLKASTFNAGFKGSNTIYDYGVEQLVFETYVPKLVIYDFSSFSVMRGKGDPYDTLSPLYPYWRNRDIWNLISEHGFVERLFFASRVYPYNSKLHSIAIFNIRKSRPGASNGYVAQTSAMSDRPLGSLQAREDGYDQKLVSFMERFILSAHERGVRLVIVVSPRHSSGTYPIPIRVQRKIDEFGIPVMDFDVASYPQFRDYRLYRDETHLNHEGANLFSRLLGERIQEWMGRAPRL